MESKGVPQIDEKTSPQNRVNDLQREAQAGTKASGNSNTHPSSPQSEETITATTNQRDEAFNSLVDRAGIGISKAVLLEAGNIGCENGTLTIDSRRERVKLSCQYCEETVSRRYRFCPACSGEITEPVREKIEQHQRRVIPLDPTTLRSLKAYLEWRQRFTYDGPLLFPFSRQRGQQIVKRMRKLAELKALTQAPETDSKKPEQGLEDGTV